LLLSAALIVRDEEAFLDDCLRSIRPVVDEIVVVDTGSIDGSVAIARRHGARVRPHPWRDDFAEARNTALDLARGRWILYIDADERLEPIDRAAVEALLDDAQEVAFRILLRPHAGSTPYREYRLWRSDPRIRFEGVIHEKVTPAIQAVAEADRRPIGLAGLVLNHVGYDGDQTPKHRRNLPMLRRQLEVEPDNLFNLHHLARVLAGLGRMEEAEATLVGAVAVARTRPHDPLGSLVFAELAGHLVARDADASALIAEARSLYPTNLFLVWMEARSLMRAGRHQEAIERLDVLLAVDTSALPLPNGPSYDERLFGELAHDTRALALFRLGRFEEAAAAYAEAERLNPQRPEYAVKRRLAEARHRRARAL
jgi:tetratricopeptide (TPR) repeat protein